MQNLENRIGEGRPLKSGLGKACELALKYGGMHRGNRNGRIELLHRGVGETR